VAVVSIIVLLALAALGGYFFGMRAASHGARALEGVRAQAARESPAQAVVPSGESRETFGARDLVASTGDPLGAEKARVIRSRDTEAAVLRRELAERDAAQPGLEEFTRERERLAGELADARAETARYRQLIVDIENNAPPPILSGAAGPDDLKLIVGVGPVLERMLHTLGVTTFQQIARWTERDIAEFDARLPEFPGRIARDQWVTQARALHLSKYGEAFDVPRSRG
jgi:predicted flap endonuclease-1-like 5' DNA nuclease